MGLSRSSYYYDPVPESEENLLLMKAIDVQYLKTPSYGSRRMMKELNKQREGPVNGKRIRRLTQVMGLETMYPKPRTSIMNKERYKYPHLLGGLKIVRQNQVWGTDITYIPTDKGYLYLVAILDLFSRYVVSWRLSDSLESDFCIEAMNDALKTTGVPEIVNSDQGCQFTSKAWIDVLMRHNIAISMSGKGRCWDNIFVERLWRSLKYEEVYLKNYETGKDAKEGIGWYFNFYNNERIHQKLDYNTPRSVYHA